MKGILILAVFAFFVYVIFIEPKRVAKNMASRLYAGDLLSGQINCQEITERLQAAGWISGKKEVRLSASEADGKSGLIEVICAGSTYQVRIIAQGDNSSMLTVAAKYFPVSFLQAVFWRIENIQYLQEADRIQCRIMEWADPSLAKQPSQSYDAFKTMYLLRYGAIALATAFFCYMVSLVIFGEILGENSVKQLYVLCVSIAAALFICFRVTLSPYIIKTRSENFWMELRYRSI